MSPQLGADVVIVGARCAGATLAALLAGAGIPTIAVERPVPSTSPAIALTTLPALRTRRAKASRYT